MKLKLTHKERRALAELAKPTGQVDYSKIHGVTINALERKGLYGFEGKRRKRRVTAAGRTALAVPNIFDDTSNKEAPMMMTLAEIDAHPMLDQRQRQVCKGLLKIAKRDGRVFTMLEFAEATLRVAGNNYAAVTDQDGLHAVMIDDNHRCAAILYVHEAIKAGPAIVTELAKKRSTLRDLELLTRCLRSA